MSKGRARQFDLEMALDSAEAVFRARGFSGAGVNDLMAAIGIGSGSFYAAFGSKSGLYEKVLARHAERRLSAARSALAHPDPRLSLIQLVEVTAADLCRQDTVAGCLFVLTGAHQLGTSARCWNRYRAALQKAIGVACNRLHRDGRADECASWIMLILDAMNIQAMAGSDRTALVAAAREALNVQLSAASRGSNWLAA